MVARGWLILVIVALLAPEALGAQFRTKNFVVETPDAQFAERVGQWAEYYRKQKAQQWLGKEMPDWQKPCPLRVKVSYNGSGGATSFIFDHGNILRREMEIEGTPERLIYSVLPHEVTHTVLAEHFRQPVPRWADEGGSVLSEDDQERTRHDQLARQIVASQKRMIPLTRLFALTQYPPDVMVLYAEGYSVTNFLVGQSSRGAFLNFIADGMRSGWDQACRTHYKYNGVNDLEQAWLQHLRDSRAGQTTAVAKGDEPRSQPKANPTSVVRGQTPQEAGGRGTGARTATGATRQTLPPMEGAPIVRGVSADEDVPPPRRPVPQQPSGVRVGPPRRVQEPQPGWGE